MKEKIYTNMKDFVDSLTEDEMIKIMKNNKLSGITPEHIVTEDNQKIKYWCVMEMKTIDGETRVEQYDDISLEDFEVIYGGIVDLITSVELRQMPEQVGCGDEK